MLLATAIATQTAAASPAQVAYPTEQIWSALLTHCGESYFYAGSALDGVGSMSAFRPDPNLIEFRGAIFHTVPIRITDADRLNGLSAHARVTMFGHIFRKKGGPWQDGPDLVLRDSEDMTARSMQDLTGDSGQMGSGGVIALDLQRLQGRWIVRRSSVRLNNTPGNDVSFDLGHVSDARISRYVCQSETIVRPPAVAAAGATLDTDPDAANKALQKRVQEGERAGLAAQRAANDAAAQARLERKLAPWKFTGSPEEFRQALAANLRMRGAQWGVNPDSYTDELAKIDQIVATCLAITPEGWRRIQAKFDQEKKGAPHDGGSSLTRRRNGGLDWCDTNGASSALGEPISAPGREYGLGVITGIPQIESSDDHSRPTGNFSITVTIIPREGELNETGPNALADIPSRVDVIKATIPMPAWSREGPSQ